MTDRPEQAAPTSVPVTEPDRRAEPSPAPTPGEQTGLERVRSLCPYLVAVDGDWRTVTPARDHVCSAVDPPAPIALDKQRRLCLVDDHVGCATYLAARRALIGDEIPVPDADVPVDRGVAAARTAEAGRAPRAPRWPVPRTAPIVVDRGRGGLTGVRLDRSVAQVGLVVLMVVAFGVLAVARLSSDGAQGPAASATPSPAGSPMRSPSPSPAATPTSSPSAPVSPSPAPSPSAPAASAATKTYRVRSGDTLSGIATRFGTTVAVLRELNDIADPSLLRVGQVLRLP